MIACGDFPFRHHLSGMMPASTSGARRSGITLESANWPQTMKVTADSVIAG